MAIEALHDTVVEDDIVPVALIPTVHLLHGGRKHGIDIVIAASEVDAVMELPAFHDGILPVAVLGVDLQEIQRKTHVEPVVQQACHDAVLDGDEDGHVLLDTYLQSIGRGEKSVVCRFRVFLNLDRYFFLCR